MYAKIHEMHLLQNGLRAGISSAPPPEIILPPLSVRGALRSSKSKYLPSVHSALLGFSFAEMKFSQAKSYQLVQNLCSILACFDLRVFYFIYWFIIYLKFKILLYYWFITELSALEE